MPDIDAPIGVTPSNIKIVDWFMDVAPYLPVHMVNRRKKLGLPNKQDVVYSAKLIGLKHTREQYNGLLIMINTAQQAFR